MIIQDYNQAEGGPAAIITFPADVVIMPASPQGVLDSVSMYDLDTLYPEFSDLIRETSNGEKLEVGSVILDKAANVARNRYLAGVIVTEHFMDPVSQQSLRTIQRTLSQLINRYDSFKKIAVPIDAMTSPGNKERPAVTVMDWLDVFMFIESSMNRSYSDIEFTLFHAVLP